MRIVNSLRLPFRQPLLAIVMTLALVGTTDYLYWRLHALDLVIADGLIVDGTGATAFHADVAIRDGKIVGISRWLYWMAPARRRINARRKIVAPGFIDVHTHIEATKAEPGYSTLNGRITTVLMSEKALDQCRRSLDGSH